jgi:hypothetical protein
MTTTLVRTRVNQELEPVSRSEYRMDKVQLEFFPFDDSDPLETKIQAITLSSTPTSGGMDTSATDGLRQGVEILNGRHLFKSNQPKIWAGNFEHATRITTFGQFRSWTEYQNSITWNDNIIEFDPVFFIAIGGKDNYPYPLYFNNGPQQGEEAAIEPLTIPFRLDQFKIEGAYPIHRPKGNIEDGNTDFALPYANSRTFQFIPYNPAITQNPFLDAGQQYIGLGPIVDDIIIEGYVDYVRRVIEPFDDTEDEEIVKQLEIDTSTVDGQDFIAQLKLLSIELDEDIRGDYTQKSAAAGYDVYGPEQARYGTDSVAYVGWMRGS